LAPSRELYFPIGVFVSVGYLIDLSAAEQIVLACAIRCRLPQPTRLADQLVDAKKRAMG